MKLKGFVFLVSLFFIFNASAIALTVESSAFKNQEHIPEQYTCDGAGLSVPLKWSQAPEETQSFVLIVEDPDAPMGLWIHWILYNIPPQIQQLQENVQEKDLKEKNVLVGKNTPGKTQYAPPCPPSGTHRYFFKLFATDTRFNFKFAPTRDELLKSLEGHILGSAELVGLYSHKK